MDKRTIIITGGLRGIGFALSKKLILEGKHRIIVTSRNKAQSEEKFNELNNLNSNAQFDYSELELTSNSSQAKFVDWVRTTYGQIDVLINNAAIVDWQVKEKNLPEVAKQVLDVNYFSTVNLTKNLLPHLRADGKIINVSAVMGSLKNNPAVVRQWFDDPTITEETISQKASELIQMRTEQSLIGWKKWPFFKQQEMTIYAASKVMLNAYSRFILTKQFSSPLQTVMCVHPGWYFILNYPRVKTDLGTQAAPLTPEQGTVSSYHALVNIPFGDKKYNAIFLDEKANQIDF